MSTPTSEQRKPSEYPAVFRFMAGTYSRRGSVGIYPLVLDGKDGSIRAGGEPAAMADPSWLDVDAGRNLLFSIGTRSADGAKQGIIASWHIQMTGSGQTHLTLIDQTCFAAGHFCHLALDPERRLVAAASYGGGFFAVVAYREDGTFQPPARGKPLVIYHRGSGPNVKRQEQAHVHQVSFDPNYGLLRVVDLGMDQIVTYAWPVAAAEDGGGRPVSTAFCPPGSGPRHLIRNRSGSRVYALMEMSVETLVFQTGCSETADLQEIQRLPALPPEVQPDESISGAAIWLTDDERFLVVSTRGYDALTLYAVDPEDGRLRRLDNKPVGKSFPRDFRLFPARGKDQWIVCGSEHEDCVQTFRLEADSGRITGPYACFPVPAPVCILALS